jgi:hypothetical protein
MPSAPLPPEKRAEINDLERAIREAVDAEISALAENLATTDAAHLFGDNEFTIRAIALGRPDEVTLVPLPDQLRDRPGGHQGDVVGVGLDGQ